jgi:hypothetical protein
MDRSSEDDQTFQPEGIGGSFSGDRAAGHEADFQYAFGYTFTN